MWLEPMQVTRYIFYTYICTYNITCIIRIPSAITLNATYIRTGITYTISSVYNIINYNTYTMVFAVYLIKYIKDLLFFEDDHKCTIIYKPSICIIISLDSFFITFVFFSFFMSPQYLLRHGFFLYTHYILRTVYSNRHGNRLGARRLYSRRWIVDFYFLF